jgi:ABC-2 type transport system ATP-binding protein
LYDDLTVKENIEFYAELYQVPKKAYKTRAERLLNFSGLGPFTDRLFRNLSGGMKQKVGLTCALIHTPRVLFLDEPTNGVDPVSRRDFWKILYELRREKVTIVVASTYLDEADRCHRVAFFKDGQARIVMDPLEMRKLIRGRLYHLEAADRRKALEVLRDAWQGGRPSIFGTGIHVNLPEDVDPDTVPAALTAAGVAVARWEEVTPGLEDVYLYLLEEERNAGR